MMKVRMVSQPPPFMWGSCWPGSRGVFLCLGVDLEWCGGAKRVLVSLKGRRVGAEHGRWGIGGFSVLSA